MTFIDWAVLAVVAITLIGGTVWVSLRDRRARLSPSDEADIGDLQRAQYDAEIAKQRAAAHGYSGGTGLSAGSHGGGSTV